MKMKNIIAVLASGALLFAGCTKEYEVTTLDVIQLSKTFISVPEDGTPVTVELTASVDWSFDKLFEHEIEGQYEDHEVAKEMKETPEWLTVSNVSGGAGTTKLTFTAEASEVGREAKLVISAGGKKQNLTVRQGEIQASVATCADVIAAVDGQSFTVTGTCTSIVNTTYGNWYLNDGTGEIYIYGTVNDSGQNAWDTFNIEVGDEVTVSGSKVTYGSTVEFVDAKFISVKKSLLQVPENGVTDFLVDRSGYRINSEGTVIDANPVNEIVAEFIVKGNGILFDIPSDMQSWAQVTDIKVVAPEEEDSEDPDTTKVTMKIASTDGTVARSGVIKFRSADGKDESSVEISVTQVPDMISMADAMDKIDPADAKKETYVKTSATIAATCRNGFLLYDGSEYLLVYADGFEYDSYKDMVGHKATVAGLVCQNNDGPQIKDVDILAIDKAEGTYTDPTESEKLDAAKINELAAQTGKGVLDIKYFTATGRLIDPYHNLVVDGTDTALAFYGNDSKVFNLDRYCEKGDPVTVKGYYISRQEGRINFIVTDMEPKLPAEEEK